MINNKNAGEDINYFLSHDMKQVFESRPDLLQVRIFLNGHL
jgi:hypothetical protein